MPIPKEVKTIIEKLKKAGFQAYIVGGCVRDILRKAKPEDWDIATNAKPEEIQETMKKAGLKTFYENEFFTVGVVWPKKKLTTKIQEIPFDIIEVKPFHFCSFEVTTFRSEAKYS